MKKKKEDAQTIVTFYFVNIHLCYDGTRMYYLSKHFEKHLILRKHLTFFCYFQYMESLKGWLQRWLVYLVNCSICNTRIYIVMTRVRQQIITIHIVQYLKK